MATQPVDPDAELMETIEAFDRALAEGRLDEFSTFFADDAHVLIHQQGTVVGKEAIRASLALSSTVSTPRPMSHDTKSSTCMATGRTF